MRVYDLGTVPYLEAWRLQEALAARLANGGDGSLLLVEHPHVFTIGRRGTLDHLTASADELRRLGAQVFRVDRGGDITYHGPGQLVAYPILDLARRGGDVVAYVRALEDAVIAAAAELGVAARRVPDRTGVWVTLPGGPPVTQPPRSWPPLPTAVSPDAEARPGPREPWAKLCAIGVRVARGVTTHGLALNVTTDLSWFERMIPCGFSHEVASLARLGVRAELAAVKPLLVRALAASLGVPIVDGGVPAPARDQEIRAAAPVRSAVDLLREPVAA